jgi:hypothetical protein
MTYGFKFHGIVFLYPIMYLFFVVCLHVKLDIDTCYYNVSFCDFFSKSSQIFLTSLLLLIYVNETIPRSFSTYTPAILKEKNK